MSEALNIEIRARDMTGGAIGAVKKSLEGLVEVAAKAAIAGGAIAGAVGGTSIKAFSDFEAAILQTKAVTEGFTDDVQKNFEDMALELGAKLPISATDAARGMGELSKAGVKANEVLAAAPALANLAVAGNLNMEDSATVLATALNGFGLEGKQAMRVVDLLAQTANASAVDVKDMGETFKYVAPAAKAAGFSIEDMSIAIGLMGNAGIKGSEAGTALRSVITRLAAPPKEAAKALNALGISAFDANGKAKPFRETLVELREKFKNMSEQEKVDFAKKIAGQEAMAGLLSIITADDKAFQDMQKSIDGAAGSSEKMAKVMSGGLKGALENLKGSVETLQIKLGKELAPAFAFVVGKLTDFANYLTGQLPGAVATVRGIIEGFTRTWNLLAWAFKPLTDAVSNFMAVMSLGKQTVDEFGNVIEGAGKKTGSAHPIIDAIGWMVRNVLTPAFEFAAPKIVIAADAIGNLAGKAGDVAPKIGEFAGKAWELYNAISPLNVVIATFKGFMEGGLPGALDAIKQKIIDAGKVFGIDLKQPIEAVANFIRDTATPVIKFLGDVFENDVKPKALAFAGFVQKDLIPAIGKIGDFIKNDALPAVQGFARWIADNAGPMIGAISRTVQDDVLPALGRFGDYITGTVIPKASELWNYITTNLKPVFEQAADIITNNVIPTLGKLVGVITDTVIPTLTNWWNVLATVLKPIFDVIVDVISNVFLPAVRTAWDFIENNLIPVFKVVGDVMNTTVMPALQTVADFLHGPLTVALDTIKSTWEALIETFKRGAGFISSVFKGDIEGAFDALAGKSKEKTAAIQSNLGDMAAKAVAAGSTTGTAFAGVTASAQTAAGAVKNYNDTGVPVKTPVFSIGGLLTNISSAISAIQRYNSTPVQSKSANPNVYASGTSFHPGGPAWIGETWKPELLRLPGGQERLITVPTLFPDLPRGSEVLNPAQTRRKLGDAGSSSGAGSIAASAGGGGGGSVRIDNLNVTVVADGTGTGAGSDAGELARRIAEEVKAQFDEQVRKYRTGTAAGVGAMSSTRARGSF